MTKEVSWPTMMNTANTSKAMLSQDHPAAVINSAGYSKYPMNHSPKNVIVQKRYSFDDNGGGYLGL